LCSSRWTQTYPHPRSQGSAQAVTRLNWTRAVGERQVRNGGREPMGLSDRTFIGGRPTRTLEPLPPVPRAPPQTFGPPRRKPKIPPSIIKPPRVTILADGSQVVLTKKQRKQRRLEEARLEKERNDQRLQQALLQLKQQVASSLASGGTRHLNTTAPSTGAREEVVKADPDPPKLRKHSGSKPLVTRLNKSALALAGVTPERWEEYLRTVAERERPVRPPAIDTASLGVTASDDD
jgi:hypothetical protein